jgi:ParB family transcriptional regulator, chromosome partitioning protein
MNAKKRALGKGLSALLDNSESEVQTNYSFEKEILPVGAIANITIDAIEANPFQPRKQFDDQALQELAASIKEQGIIQPITVRKLDNNKFQLISGERRFRAATLAGLSAVPAYIRSATDQNMLEMAIVENIQRENLNPIEVSMGYQQLIDDCKLTQEVLGERLGKPRSSIANYLRLLKLPGEIQIGISQEQITMGHAKALLSVDNVQTQIEIFHDIVAQGLSVREVEEIAQNIGKQTDEEEITATPIKKATAFNSEKYNELQQNLASIYGTKVQIKAKADGKGNIVIPFKSKEELERIINLVAQK